MRRLLIFLLLGGYFATPLAGQIPSGVEGEYEPHPEAEEAISQLLSPYCPGFMLEVCTAEQSRILRDSIHALAIKGWTAGELVGWMLANHGEEYRALPERSGTGMWAWLFPPFALLLGAGIVVSAARRMRRPGQDDEEARDSPEPELSLSSEDEARLRAAIRDMELSEDPSY